MTSTKQQKTEEHPQNNHQVQRPSLISPGDITYLLGALFLSGMRVIPVSHRVWMLNKLSIFLGQLLYRLNVHTTKKIRQNVNTVFKDLQLMEGTESCVHQLLSLIVWNSLVLNNLPVFSREQITNLVPIQGISYLDQCQGNDRPTLIWGFHFGVHPLIVAVMLHTLGYSLHAVTHVRQMPVNASHFQRRYLRRLGRIGDQLPVIDPREGLQRNMLDILRSNACLYVTPDYMLPPEQFEPKSAFVVPIDFLGRRAFMQTGALRLAKRLKAKVIMILARQEKNNKQELIVEPFDLPTSGFTPSDLQHDLQSCMQRLETRVLSYPHLWWDVKRDDFTKRLRVIS